MPLKVLYSSMATEHLDAQAMRRLLAHARERNTASDISGVLIHYPCSGEIVQVLEGPKPAVLALLARPRADPRHQRMVVHFEAEIRERDLGKWPMGFLSASPDADEPDSEASREITLGARLKQFIRGAAPSGATLH